MYSLDLALALADAGVRLMVLNPKASHNFAKGLLRNSKTDAVDADTLAQYAERMPFQPWARPLACALAPRALARRINALTKDKAATKNQQHALTFSPETPNAVRRDVTLAIAQLEKRIERLTEEAVAFIRAHPPLARPFVLLLTVKGIGETSAIALTSRVAAVARRADAQAMGQERRARSAPFHVGHRRFDPRAALQGRQPLYPSGALYAGVDAKAHDPHVRGFFEHLTANGKTPLQAVCAVMRKLLHAIHGMLKHDRPFDNSRFYAMPA